jgi:hypothetical protein
MVLYFFQFNDVPLNFNPVNKEAIEEKIGMKKISWVGKAVKI